MSRATFPFEIDKNFSRKKLVMPAITAAIFGTLALGLFFATGESFPLINFGYLGTALGVGLSLYAILPKRQKPMGRRVTLLGAKTSRLRGFGRLDFNFRSGRHERKPSTIHEWNEDTD